MGQPECLAARGAHACGGLEHDACKWLSPVSRASGEIEALTNHLLQDAGIRAAGKRVADAYLASGRTAFEATGQMFEKYDAERPGEAGGGGEYVRQAGFGWTNGVALLLLDQGYGGMDAV